MRSESNLLLVQTYACGRYSYCRVTLIMMLMQLTLLHAIMLMLIVIIIIIIIP